jgi:2-polyprenyl-6-methoxyphenol hydroxylase-like FAD-dependent oxidoreductase
MYDAIIIGARCAGSPTAMLLARKGYRVLAVDRATFPSNTISTHFIHQAGVAHLDRWGLLDRIRDSNCPPVSGISFDVGDFALKGSPPAADGCADAYAPRRKVLDKILFDAAAEAGAEVREGFSVRELVFEGGRVTGIRGQATGGAVVTEKARVVVGADGQRSAVARAVEAPAYNVLPTYTCNYYSYWSGVPFEFAELYPRDGRLIVGAPTNDGLTMITVVWPRAEFDRVRADVEGNFMGEIERLVPRLAERMRAGRREERFYGTGDIPNFFRKPYGPGWALVGDAGYHKDPVGAQGITNSFQSAELLVEALERAFSGRSRLDDALALYERRRNEKMLPLYEYNSQLATLSPPPPDVRRLLAALRWNQHETNRFMGILAGTVPVREFFSPENMRRVVGEAELVADAA